MKNLGISAVRLVVAVVALVVARPSVVLGVTLNKTPKAQTYARLESFVGHGWDKIFDNVVSKLDSLDYSKAHELIVSRAGDHALTDPGIPSLDAGVILIGSHSPLDADEIAVEFYKKRDLRDTRYAFLNGTWYGPNEISTGYVDTNTDGRLYTIDLTLDGIARIANGHDGLALVAACSAASVHSSLGSRVTLGYAGDVYADVARADFEGVSDVLASTTFGVRSVDVAKAANGNQTMAPELGIVAPVVVLMLIIDVSGVPVPGHLLISVS